MREKFQLKVLGSSESYKQTLVCYIHDVHKVATIQTCILQLEHPVCYTVF